MLPFFKFLDTTIFTYPLIMGVIWGLSYHFCLFLIEYKNLNIPNFKTFFLGIFFSSWLGAKIFYLLSLSFEVVKEATISPNFWLGGGFVFYGGLIGSLFFVLIFKKLNRLSWENLEFAIPVLCLGHSLGRIGCLLAGCCFGATTELPFRLHLHGAWRHPVQLYEAICLFMLFIFIFESFKKGKPVVLFYLFSYGIIRFLLEFLRGDKIRGENIISILSTSQVIALCFITLALIISFFKRRA